MRSTSSVVPRVELSEVTAGYDRRFPVVQDLSLEWSGPGLYLIQGPNGSGKSTLLELLSGYLAPWQGEVLVNGVSASSDSARRMRRICRTQPALYPAMTVQDHLAFTAVVNEANRADVFDRAERYGLTEWFGHDAKSLSTGNARKLWLVMCTTGSYDVLALDEPYNGLDELGIDELHRDLQDRRADTLILLISHTLARPSQFTHEISMRSLTGGGSSGRHTVLSGGASRE